MLSEEERAEALKIVNVERTKSVPAQKMAMVALRLDAELREAVAAERERIAALVPKVCPACSTNDLGDHVKDAEQVADQEWGAVECECSAIAAAIREGK